MTSAPVTASVKSYFTETQTAATSSAKRDVENSFSDVFNNQKSDTKTAEPEREVTTKRVIQTSSGGGGSSGGRSSGGSRLGGGSRRG